MTASDAWEAIVGTAVLGTSRRPLDVAALPAPVAQALDLVHAPDRMPSTGQPDVLLDAAALLAVYLRAGHRLLPLPDGRPLPEPDSQPDSQPDSRPVPALARARLGELIASSGGAPGGQSSGGHTTGLLLVWLSVAAARGFSAPAEHLPGLLRLAVRNAEIKAAVLPVLGPRGHWLARQNPDWAGLVPAPSGSSAPSSSTEDDPAYDPADDPAWTHGTLARRREFFARVRSRDPDAARDLLLGRPWMSNDGPARVALTTELAQHLSPRDEAVLELALADRRQDVRGVAAGLLAQLPDSEYVRRVSAIAQDCLRVQRVALRRTLVISLPDPDQDVPPLPPLPAWLPDRSQAGPAAQRLLRLLTVVPLAHWNARLGARPEDLLGLPVSDGLRGTVHAGWSVAAQRQQNAAWAAALITVHGGGAGEQLLAVVPSPDRARLVTAALAADGRGARTMLSLCPQPWPPPLAGAVLLWLAAVSADQQPWAARDLLQYTGQALPPEPENISAMHALAARFRPGHPWNTAFTTVAETMLYHRQMLEELR